MKKILVFGLALLFLVMPNASKADSNDIKLWVDGSYVTTDAKPYIEDSRTLVPIRFIAEALGYNVEWNDSTRTVILSKGSEHILMNIGSRNATHNGRPTTLYKEPQLKNSRTFVPVRDIAERFGKKIDWDQKNWTVVIGSGYKTPTPVPGLNPSQSGERLSAKDARKMVVDRFGGIVEKIEYTYNETNPLYKGEALKKGSKVVFEINARTRKFVKWDIGNDNKWDEFASELPNFISMDQAANKVIAQSGKDNTFVQKIDFKYDGNETIYQGEAFNRGVKYVFELYAKTNQFKKWSVDGGDETWVEQYSNVK